jgi:hypothetical protein
MEEDDDLDTLWTPPTSKTTTPPQKPLKLVVDHDSTPPPYSAFNTKDKLRGFIVECASSHKAFYYPQLLSVTLNHPHNTALSLVTSTAVIQVFGRNLRPILSAFRLQTCDSITEFSAAAFQQPSDDSQPFIENIEILSPMPTIERQKGAGAKQREEV